MIRGFGDDISLNLDFEPLNQFLMYESLIKPILFLFDPEFMHDFFVSLGEVLGDIPGGATLVGVFCDYEHPSLETNVAGIDFKNPIGLAAGFDKDVAAYENHAVRRFRIYGGRRRDPISLRRKSRARELLRLPEDRSIIVYYGLKNIGADAVKEKLPDLLPFKIPVGLNIAKTNRADIKGEKSVEDYVTTYRMLAILFHVRDPECFLPECPGRPPIPGSAPARQFTYGLRKREETWTDFP